MPASRRSVHCAVCPRSLVEQPRHRAVPRLDVVERAVDGGVPADLAQRGDVARHDRRPARQRLDYRQAEAFALRRHEQQRAPPIDGGERRPIQGRQDDDRVAEAEIAHERLLRGGERTPDAHQPEVAVGAAQRVEHAQQHVDPLARDRAADVEQVDECPAVTEQSRGVDVGGRLGVRRAARMRTVRHDRRPLAGNAGLRDEGVAGGVAVAGDVTGLLQPIKNVAGHRAKERRARLERRVEHAAKRVQVVTRDDRPASRKPVDELRVAVVDDVKQIEAVGKPGDASLG